MECAFTSPVRTECGMLYAVLYVRINCFVVRGCAVSRRYINICNSDVLSVVNMYIDHLKFYVVYSNDEEQRQRSSRSAWPACQNIGKAREVSAQFAQHLAKTTGTAPPLVGCVIWSQNIYF